MILDNIFQIAYVTRDIEKAIENFRSQADVRAEYHNEATMVVKTPTGPRDMHVKLAFLWVGDFQYELIQPISGLEEIYHAALPADSSLAFHHTCVRVADWEQFRGSLDQQPYPIAFEVDDGPVRFVYLDARKQFGHYLEYTNMPDEIWAITGGR